MNSTWWTRFVIVIATLLWGVYMLLPTFLGPSAAERNAASAAEVAGAAAGGPTEDAGWGFLLPESRINLGIDIQGGIDLTLEVDVEEAVLSSVQRDVRPLEEAARADGVGVDEVRRARGEPTLLVALSPTGDTGKLSALMQRSWPGYDLLGTRELDGRTWQAWGLRAEVQAEISRSAVLQAEQTLRNRIDETGVKEPAISMKGENRISVQLPGMANTRQAVDAIGTTAVLAFMMVDEDTMAKSVALQRGIDAAQAALPPADYADDRLLSDHLVSQGVLPRGSRLMWEYEPGSDGKPARLAGGHIAVLDNVILTGDDINDAQVSFDDRTGMPNVAMSFKPRGARVFADATEQNVGRRFAIVLDDQVRSAPVIRERIAGGRASIEMGTSDMQSARDDAATLSLVLRTGSLPAPVNVGDVREVGASLGGDAIRSSLLATVIGGAIVIVFMVAVYRLSGVAAVLALSMNVLLVLALLAAVGATLTLPGIAGIALTVGMAVDCNIIIYERIREERKLGKTARSSVDAGFDKALWSVLDANITTFIAGVVLYTYGTGPIKGFSVTLMIGILTTLFTGIFVSRTFMDFLARKSNARLSI